MIQPNINPQETNRLTEEQLAIIKQQNESDYQDMASKMLPSDILDSEEDVEKEEDNNFQFRPILPIELQNINISPITEQLDPSFRLSNPSMISCLSPARLGGGSFLRSNFSLRSWGQVQGIQEMQLEEDFVDTDTIAAARQLNTEM